jgi:hypothetical protein
MASTISNINQAQVDERIVEALRHVLPLFSMFSYIIEEDDRIENDVVRVPIALDPTVGNKTAGTFKAADGSLTGTNVTYDKFRAAGWDAVEATLRGSMLSNYWADKAAGAVYGVAKDVIDTALALVTATNYGNTAADKLVVAPASFAQEDMGLLWEKAQTKIKRQEKTFLMNSSYAGALLGQSTLGLVFATAGNNFIETGKIPNLMGLNVAHYGDMPDNSENLGGAVIGKAAIAAAIARPGFFLSSGDGNIVERRIVTDSDSGLSAMYTVKADAGGTMSGEVAMLFGVAKAQDSIVRLLVS